MDYLGWNLVIRSEIEIPGGWPLDRPAVVSPDVSIVVGKAELAQSRRIAPPYAFGDAAILFEAPDAGRYLIEYDCIVVEPSLGAAPGHVGGLLIATALPALLWLRDRFVLHASCAAPPGGAAVAFTGSSGSGKSLLATQLLHEGWDVIGDDSIVLDAGVDGVSASGLSGCFHVGPPPASPREDRPVVMVPSGQRRREAALAAICALRPAAGSTLNLRRLDPLDALTALLANRHRPAVARGLGVESRWLPKVATMARLVPVSILEFDPARVRAAALIALLEGASERDA